MRILDLSQGIEFELPDFITPLQAGRPYLRESIPYIECYSYSVNEDNLLPLDTSKFPPYFEVL